MTIIYKYEEKCFFSLEPRTVSGVLNIRIYIYKYININKYRNSFYKFGEKEKLLKVLDEEKKELGKRRT